MTMNTFEGKRGEEVESEEAVSWYYDYGGKTDRYHDDNDPAFRLEVGPSIPLYGECGLDESLFGLQLDLEFGAFGTIRGIVQPAMKKIVHGGLIESAVNVFEVAWRCGPNYDDDENGGGETFLSTHEDGNDIIAWYYGDRTDRPGWLDDNKVDDAALNFIRSLKAAPEGTRLVNWQQPYEAEEVFGGLNDDANEERWQTTLNRLNDPDAAECYGSPSDKSYPIPFLLACYAFAISIDGSTTLPTLVTPDDAYLYELVDEFMRVLATRDHPRAGYGQLMGLEHIVEQFREEPARDGRHWKNAYRFAQALMLVLSDDYEHIVRDYHMVDDPERLYELCANILAVFNAHMLPSGAPSDAAREQLRKDLDFNNSHLREGSFMSIVTDEDFQDIGDNRATYVKFKGCLGKKRDFDSSSDDEKDER